jgi:hypothetical protein
MLSAEQRDAIGKGLADHWIETWGMLAENLVMMRGSFPNVPEDLVARVLDPTQRDVWKAMTKGQQTMMFMSEENEGLKDDETDQAPAANPVNDAKK